MPFSPSTHMGLKEVPEGELQVALLLRIEVSRHSHRRCQALPGDSSTCLEELSYSCDTYLSVTIALQILSSTAAILGTASSCTALETILEKHSHQSLTRGAAHLSLFSSDFSLSPFRKSDFSNASAAASAFDLMASAAWLAGPGPLGKMGDGIDSRPAAWQPAEY